MIDDVRLVWAAINSGLLLAGFGWVRRQNTRVNEMYQHLFGIPGNAGNGGTTARLRALETRVSEVTGEASESAAGREINRSLDLLHKALAEASDATKLAKSELHDRLTTIDKRLLALEVGKRPGRR